PSPPAVRIALPSGSNAIALIPPGCRKRVLPRRATAPAGSSSGRSSARAPPTTISHVRTTYNQRRMVDITNPFRRAKGGLPESQECYTALTTPPNFLLGGNATSEGVLRQHGLGAFEQGVLARLGVGLGGAGQAEAHVAVGLLGCQRRDGQEQGEQRQSEAPANRHRTVLFSGAVCPGSDARTL